MTNRQEFEPDIKPRRVACAGCGTAFACTGDSSCWCAEETVRLPMPVEGEDCLCRHCLRKAAATEATRRAER